MKNIHGFIFMAILAMFDPTLASASVRSIPVGNTTSSEDGSKQICFEPNIAQDVMTQRIQEAVVKDPSGNYKVEGCNATPQQFVEMVNAIPELRGDRDLPQSVNQLAGFYSKLKICNFVGEHFLAGMNGSNLVLSSKHARPAKPQEKALCLNGKMVFAGYCHNSPVVQYVVTLGSVEVAGNPWRPRTQLAAFDPGSASCPAIITIRIFESGAVNVTGVREQTGDERGGRRVKGAKPGSFDGTGREEYRVSRGFGKAIANSGSGLSTQSHNVVVTIENGDQEMVLYEGPITGEKVVTLNGELENDSKIVVRPIDANDFASPSRYGVHVWADEISYTCGRNIVTMIER